MATTILLTKKKGDTTQEVPFKVESITILQFQLILKVVKDIIKAAQKDSDVLGTIEELMNPKPVFVEEGANREEVEAAADRVYFEKIMEAMELLLEVLPDKAFELMAVASGINKELLVAQKAEMIFDIIEAVDESNDINALVKRAKKSLAAIMTKYQFKAFTKKKAAAKNVQA